MQHFAEFFSVPLFSSCQPSSLYGNLCCKHFSWLATSSLLGGLTLGYRWCWGFSLGWSRCCSFWFCRWLRSLWLATLCRRGLWDNTPPSIKDNTVYMAKRLKSGLYQGCVVGSKLQNHKAKKKVLALCSRFHASRSLEWPMSNRPCWTCFYFAGLVLKIPNLFVRLARCTSLFHQALEFFFFPIRGMVNSGIYV